MKREPFNLLVDMISDYLKQKIRIPAIQRESKIWSLEQKQNFIDSLYNDFDIPKIYLRKGDGGVIWWLIDGQQRLTSIQEFINDEYTLGEVSTLPSNLWDKKCSQLKPEDKEKIVGRKLDCILVECDDDEEEDMFLRLNNGTPLSAAEKRNAIRGLIRDSVHQLASHKYFKKKVSFSPKRFGYDAAVAQLYAIYLAGEATDTKSRSLMKIYEDNKQKFHDQKNIERVVKRTLNTMDKIFPNKEPYMKKYNVVSIFLFLYELNSKYVIANISNPELFKFFNEFETSRVKNAQISEDHPNYDIDLGKYQTACIDSPDSEEGIRIRHEIIMKKFLIKYQKLELKDKYRDFTEDQKRAIYLLNERKCKNIAGYSCPVYGKPLAFEDCEFDHIKEHNEGGKTIVSNGQILCKDCHTYKTSVYNRSLHSKKNE